MADLVTLEEYKAVLGIGDFDQSEDVRFPLLVDWASQAIRNYTGRDFGSLVVTEDRIFDYDGSGYLDIDDASSILSVTQVVPGGIDLELDPLSWAAAPSRRDDAPVYYYIIMPDYVGQTFGSPEMGFERNLDVYAREARGRTFLTKIRVNAVWGWPDVPGDVKLATIWTIEDWVSKPSAEGLTSESIAGFARAWGNRNSAEAAGALAIPNRARDLLFNYQKHEI